MDFKIVIKEHIYMRPEVNSNQFEKSFRLHVNFTATIISDLKWLSKIVPFIWQFHCDNFPNHSKILLYMRKW